MRLILKHPRVDKFITQLKSLCIRGRLVKLPSQGLPEVLHDFCMHAK